MHKTLAIAATALLLGSLQARTWTSADGRTLDGDFVSATDTHVTVRKANHFQTFQIPLAGLSKEDQEFVAGELAGGSEDKADSETPIKLPKALQAIVDERGSVLLEDDFNREDPDDAEELGENWSTNSASRAQGEKQNDLVDGALVMTISPKADHAISCVHSTSEPYADAVAYVRVKLEEGGSLKLAFNDKSYKAVWAGHINGVNLTTKSLTMDDEKTGRFDLTVRDLKDTDADAYKTIIEDTTEKFSVKVREGNWHELVTHHEGETLTAYLDGKKIGKFASPGFGHPTKRQFVFAVPKHAVVDHVKLWSLTPADKVVK